MRGRGTNARVASAPECCLKEWCGGETESPWEYQRIGLAETVGIARVRGLLSMAKQNSGTSKTGESCSMVQREGSLSRRFAAPNAEGFCTSDGGGLFDPASGGFMMKGCTFDCSDFSDQIDAMVFCTPDLLEIA